MDGIFNPLKINLDKIYGQVDFRACYEGTQNQATFKLRKMGNLTFIGQEYFSTISFYRKICENGDTILLDFKTEKPQYFSDTLGN